MFDPDERAKQERRDSLNQKRMAAQFREDVQKMMALPEARRTVWTFMVGAGMDRTACRFGSDGVDMPTTLVAAAMQDNARWWLDAIRDHCPEREAQMRAEARKANIQANDAEGDADE